MASLARRRGASANAIKIEEPILEADFHDLDGKDGLLLQQLYFNIENYDNRETKNFFNDHLEKEMARQHGIYNSGPKVKIIELEENERVRIVDVGCISKFVNDSDGRNKYQEDVYDITAGKFGKVKNGIQ